MVRVTKDPEERRTEIMDTALEIFNKKGFEQTAVSDIVKKIGIAQGTFYYYFDSKESILNAILERFLEGFQEIFSGIAQDGRLNALEKTQALIEGIFKIGMDYDEGLVEYAHQERNEALHRRVEEKALVFLKPILLQILNEGISQGIYHIDYPEEAVEILLYGSVDLIHRHYFNKDRDVNINLVNAMTNIIERIFGAEIGSIKINIT